jgi:hypothetical protein
MAALLLSAVVATSGCAALGPWGAFPGLSSEAAPTPETRVERDGALADAYRRGVREALRHLAAGPDGDPRWTWVAPLAQEVWVPPQIRQGVYIPGHREWVLIEPAQWRLDVAQPRVPPRAPMAAPPAVAPPATEPPRAPRPGGR